MTFPAVDGMVNVVSGSGRKIPFLIDNNPKMVNKGRGRLRNDVTTELYRTPTK